MAYDVLVEMDIDTSRQKVFAMLMDFGGIKDILPDMIDTCEVEGEGIGAIRKIGLAEGAKVVERLDVSFEERVFAYSITENNFLPLTNYSAVVTLSDTTAGGTKVQWGSNWIPNGASADEIREMLSGLYTNIINGLAA